MTIINNTVNDSDVVYGSTRIQLSASSSAPNQFYETSNFKLTPEVARFVRKSSKGIPTGRVSILGERTGTTTVHLPTSTVPAPIFGDSFSAVKDGVTYSCTITKVDRDETDAGETMIPISFDVNIGAVVLSVAT